MRVSSSPRPPLLQAGTTALSWAAQFGRCDIGQVLIDAGADIDAVDAVSSANGSTSVACCTLAGQAVGRFAGNIDAACPQSAACREGIGRGVARSSLACDRRWLLVVSQDGLAPIAMAMRFRRINSLELLLTHGADVTVKDGVSAPPCEGHPGLVAKASSSTDQNWGHQASGEA